MVNRNVGEFHGSIHLLDQGQGIPLLLVHGFPFDHTMWLPQRSLSDCCRLLTPDLRGFGRSRSAPCEMTMRQMADDLVGLLDALSLDQPIVLGGLSMGGYVALQFWQAYRERLAGLILCDTRAAADAPEVAAGRELAAERALREGVATVTDEMLPRLFADGTLPQDPKLVDRTRQMIAHSFGVHIRRGPTRDGRSSRDARPAVGNRAANARPLRTG